MPSGDDCNIVTETPFGPVVGHLPSAKWNEQQQTKVVILNNQHHLESTLHYLQKGWMLEFQIGPSLFGKDIKLFTNHPKVTNGFSRDSYHLLEWRKGDGDVTSGSCFETNVMFASLLMRRAGSFHYYFRDGDRDELLGSGYFIVDPVMSFDSDNVISLDSLKVQTVLAKNLGTFDNWENRLRVSKESGYNMIHFTPIQELGGSNSSYSLKDQLKLNSAFASQSFAPTFDDVFRLTEKMRKEWKVLSIVDVVLNHTANESPWLQTHPECTYNMQTAPYLIPAAILDGHLHVFTREVSQGKFADIGIPPEIYNESHLEAIKNYLERTLLPRLRLHEFYTANVDKLCEEFLAKARTCNPVAEGLDKSKMSLVSNWRGGRNRAKVDMDLSLKIFNVCRNDITDEETRLMECANDFKKRLRQLNSDVQHEVDQHLTSAVTNCLANMRYFRLQEDGPRLRAVSDECPLVPRYFTGKFETGDSVEEEVLNEGQFVMAHNGWIMCSDPLKNFADSQSNVYLRRELIAWGDCVKLRYGNSYSDCPFLWDHMRSYVEESARIFDGIRLDNCHSTPLHVAEYLLDSARQIRPDLYVVAELFTNSDVVDNIFANRLGITSMIRESLTAYNSHELGRLIHRYGGEPVGSFCKRKKSLLMPSVAHALFYDVTHDNPCPITKKSVFDSVPTAALLSMAYCATGSTRGVDELVPHHIHVVTEKRLYPSWTDSDPSDNSVVGLHTGFISVKRCLNQIHEELSEGGFNQVFVDQMNENIVAVTRHNPRTHESVVLVAHTAFTDTWTHDPRPNVRNLTIEGNPSEIIAEARISRRDKETRLDLSKDFKPDEDFINGLTDYEVTLRENIPLTESSCIRTVSTGDPKKWELEFNNFPPGSVVIVRVQPHDTIRPALERLKDFEKCLVDCQFDSKVINVVSKLSLKDLNHALYRCSEEDLEEGTGSYNVPGYGRLVYCGLQGFESVLQDVVTKNDLGHPLCNNLREGDWMLDYVVGRLKTCMGTVELGYLLQEIFEDLRQVPKFLVPRYFDVVVSSVCSLLKSRAAFQMSEFVREGSTFVRHLALGSVQCVGLIESAPLPPFSPGMVSSDDGKRKVTMSAGLPHFATGYMRSWGRDTFISLRGLLLLTGRFEEARFHILGYAACLRHGLIPNLLDRGVNARYNCRDAVWWWLYSVTSYVALAPDGADILREVVSRIFPNDDCPPMGPGLVNQPLHEIMQESLNVHFRGLSFRERNAGPGIDAHMSDEGFNNHIGVDMETGFVYGGNEFNCGTWMDKMGSDVKTGTRGKPATPRDGSAVELVGLCKAVVRELHTLNQRGVYPHAGVEKLDEEGNLTQWTFKEWDEKIADNFERSFWIPESVTESESNPELVHRRLIYKDCLGASQPWADYQLRPNFLVALSVAPEMVTPANAWKAIKTAEEILLGPLGIKTLDPADWNYNGYYNNDDDSDNSKTAHGFNYHQGPEWLWPVGFFLRAKLHFARLMGGEELQKAVTETRLYLCNHYQEVVRSPWRSLPELTNKDGQYCSSGCRVQAWSMACILEVLYDLDVVEREISTA